MIQGEDHAALFPWRPQHRGL